MWVKAEGGPLNDKKATTELFCKRNHHQVVARCIQRFRDDGGLTILCGCDVKMNTRLAAEMLQNSAT